MIRQFLMAVHTRDYCGSNDKFRYNIHHFYYTPFQKPERSGQALCIYRQRISV